MKGLHKILFVTRGLIDERETIKQVLSLAREHKADVTALIIYPEFEKKMSDYKNEFESALVKKLQNSLEETSKNISAELKKLSISIETECVKKSPAVRIVQHVIKEGYDLVIKSVEPDTGSVGFKAIDMTLMRTCPCPVWLSRPISQHRKDIKIAVAVDPRSENPEEADLSKEMLKLGSDLASTCSGTLDVVACWDYELEGYLRDNVWFRVSDEVLDKDIKQAEDTNLIELKELIHGAKIKSKHEIHHLRGKADQMIAQFVKDNHIDILVMGTVVRTGLPGFIIGNTAENTMQKLTCSLITMKPIGFVSPVKAY